MSLRVTIDQNNRTGNALLFSREGHQLGDHAILRGRSAAEQINRVLTFAGQSLKGPPESSQLLRFADTPAAPIVAATVPTTRFCRKAGAGDRLQIQPAGRRGLEKIGEAGELSAQVYGANPTKKMGMNVSGCDNLATSER